MMLAPRIFRRALAERSGSVALMFVIFLPIAILCLGLGVDLMMLFTERRKAQGIVDIAAIIAAQSSSDPERAAREILAVNGYDTITTVEMGRLEGEDYEKAVSTKTEIEVIAGRYVPDPDKNFKQRFAPGQTPYNAARVRMKKKGQYYFVDHFIDAPMVEVSATASRQALAAFSVGSRLVTIDDGVLNDLLGALIGANVELSVLDYQGLMNADIEVFEFIDALASEMKIEAGTYEDVLKSDPTLSDVMNAMLDVSGSGPVTAALEGLLSYVDGLAGNVDLQKVIDLGPAGVVSLGEPMGTGFPAYVRAFDLVFANAVVADGERLVHLDLSASAPGLASFTAALEIGEPMKSSPWLSVGQGGETVTNVQARLFIEAAIGGKGLLSGANVRVPVYRELAQARGELQGVECPGGRVENITVRLNATSSVADAWIGDVDFSKSSMSTNVDKAKLVSAPAVKIFGKAHAGTQASSPSTLDFTWNDIANGVVKTTRTENAVNLLVQNLVDDLDLEVSALGLGLSSGALTKGALGDALGALSGPIGKVADDLLTTLGVSLGEGDFRVNGAKCDHAVLVQ